MSLLQMFREVFEEMCVPHRRMGAFWYYPLGLLAFFATAIWAPEGLRKYGFVVAVICFVIGRIDMHIRYRRTVKTEEARPMPMATYR